MKNHMSFMDVVGNNIANVNTIAYKSSRVTFQDILGQTVKGASSPQAGRGGTNAAQIGLGMQLGGIDNIMSQGSLQSTGKLTDFAIQGEGFFVVSDGTRNYYTRDGAFDIDVAGNLVNPVTGLQVMGWAANPSTGAVNVEGPLEPLAIPFGTRISARATSEITMAGNLDAGTVDYAAGPPVAGMVGSTVTVYDTLGNAITVNLEFRKTGVNEWTVVGTYEDDNDPNNAPATANVTLGPIQFDASTGAVSSPADGIVNFELPTLASDATAPLVFDINFGSLTQFAGASQLNVSTNNGAPAGALVSFAVGSTGEVTGIYSNGANQIIGQLALASFVNPAGLLRQGQNLWAPSSNSGDAIVGLPNTNGRGSVSTGTLEGSNVDLAQQFTNVILAQRGFQSSSRVVSAGDQMLQDLVNIIR
jgi:flagellar hook protein FlgE